MADEIAECHHELSTIPLRKFTPVEINLFLSIVFKICEEDDKTVRLTSDRLKDLSNYKTTANNCFTNDLEMTYDKLMGLRFGKRSANELDIDRFVMSGEFKMRGAAKNPYVDI